METPKDGRYVYHGNVSKSDIRAAESKAEQRVSTLESKTDKEHKELWKAIGDLKGSTGKVLLVIGLLGALLGSEYALWKTVSNARQESTDKVERIEDDKIDPLKEAFYRHAARSDQRLKQLEDQRTELKADLDKAEEEIRRLQRRFGIRPIQKTEEETE